MTTPTETLIKALRILASDIQSEDGVANAAILEAAQRMEEMNERIKRLEKLGRELYETVGCGCGMSGPCRSCRDATDKWDEYKEAKP
jgi:cbb3-type cytochrome oxidase cytochrome c subunit